MLEWVVRVAVAATILVFMAGMQFGFGQGHGSRALRGLLFGSIMLVVGAAAWAAWMLRSPSPWLVVPGAVWALAGCALFIWTMRHHPGRPDKAFASDAPREITTSGPYGWVRHPIYLSYLVATLGVALLVHSWAVAVLAAWLSMVYAHAARMEERLILASPHGARYADYRRHVGMFGPFGRRRRTHLRDLP